ncbi:MAG: hypothetical protein ACFB02_09575 [Mastigocoleus sp.]
MTFKGEVAINSICKARFSGCDAIDNRFTVSEDTQRTGITPGFLSTRKDFPWIFRG